MARTPTPTRPIPTTSALLEEHYLPAPPPSTVTAARAALERVAAHRRRLEERHAATVAARRARLDDLTRFLNGSVNIDKLVRLARAFMAIKWDQWRREHFLPAPISTETPEECWLAIRLACLPWPLSGDVDVPADSRMVRLLNSGDAVRASPLRPCGRHRR